jgi:hypothetical protein
MAIINYNASRLNFSIFLNSVRWAERVCSVEATPTIRDALKFSFTIQNCPYHFNPNFVCPLGIFQPFAFMNTESSNCKVGLTASTKNYPARIMRFNQSNCRDWYNPGFVCPLSVSSTPRTNLFFLNG